MTAAVLAGTGRPASAARPAAPAYQVALSRDWAGGRAAWAAALREGAGTPFQHPSWLDAWYATKAAGGVEPLVVTVTEEGTGELALLLPLVLRRVGSVRVVEFADVELSDYNAPVLGPAAPRDPREAERLWRALRRALPGDLARFIKMPSRIGGRPNPLALVEGVAPCPLSAHLITIEGSFEDYRRHTLARRVRMDLERSWRVFTRHPEARFEVAADPERALEILACMERQQAERIRALGLPYLLDAPENRAFYEALVRDHLSSGFTFVTALTAGEEMVAVVFGVADGETMIILRVSNAGGAWTNCSPSRILIERSMEHFHGLGYRRFDYGIGDYAYKDRLGAVASPLVDLTAALSWRGLPQAGRARAVARLRRHPELDAKLRRLLGKGGHAGEKTPG